jgi:hypothetical protein
MIASLLTSARRPISNTPYSLLPTLYSLLARDWLIAAALFIGGLVAYVSTLAPTLLDGDAALFQYTPAVLGVTYPTGYPTYILLGRLWTLLVPIGSVAYRMNLFSAVCGALALAFLYPALRRLLESRLAALSAILIFATLPTYWRWATEAKIYTLHILFLGGILSLLARWGESANQGLGARGRGELRTQGLLPPDTCVLLAALLFGLALGNHSTTLLLAPGLFLLFWLNCCSSHLAPHVSHITDDASRFTFYALRLTRYLLPIVLLPLLLYLYIPLRAEWLLARDGTLSGLTVPVAVARGLVADFYHSGLGGLVRYFTAADFTGGVVTNWGQVPRQLVTVYWPLVRDDFTPWGAALALVGAVYFAAWRPRRFWPLFLMYAILIPFVLTYGQGEQSAFLLPSSLMLAIFGGAAVAGGLRLISRIGNRESGIRNQEISPPRLRRAGRGDQGIGESGLRESARAAQPGRADSLTPTSRSLSLLSAVLTLGLMAAVAWLPVRQAQGNVDWLAHKWDDAAYQYWTDVLAHPMEPGAGMLAHWGDLTSFWYLQHVEGLRPDLYGLYPPTEEVVVDWLAAGHDLYIAGPLQGWAAGVETRYQMLPWGRLVRLASLHADPLTLLPDLRAVSEDVVFGDRLRLLRSGFQARAPSGGIVPVTLAWQTTGSLPADADISLRLVDGDGDIVAQIDEALVSGWLPADSLAPGQVMLSFHRFKLPAGTLPGDYGLQLALFQPHRGGWTLADGRPTFDLGRVTLTPADPSQPPDPWDEYKPLRGINFGGEIRLVGYDYSVTRAGQGKGFEARFLWQAIRPPGEDYTLWVELVDAKGKVWRDWRHIPSGGRAPTSTWAGGQPVHDQVALVLPADAPPGENTLRVRLSWERADGTRLPARRWLLPTGNGVTLPGVQVVEKEGRLFEPPPVGHTARANFDGKIQLLGYDLPAERLSPGDSLPLTLVWQSSTSDMRESYTVFVHLVGPDGTIHGQSDKVPGERGKQPTTGWVTNEVVVDPIPVPLAPDAPPGTYRLLVGLYLAPGGSRLPLRDASGAIIGDALELTQIEVD